MMCCYVVGGGDAPTGVQWREVCAGCGGEDSCEPCHWGVAGGATPQPLHVHPTPLHLHPCVSVYACIETLQQGVLMLLLLQPSLVFLDGHWSSGDYVLHPVLCSDLDLDLGLRYVVVLIGCLNLDVWIFECLNSAFRDRRVAASFKA